jgi:hypothetical protein
LTYPEPDRSDYAPNFTKTDENPVVDVGWAKGVLSDDRPFRAECWAQDGATYLTLFFSRLGLEAATREAIEVLLEGEGLLRFTGESRPVTIELFRDAAGNDLLMTTVVIGTEEGVTVEDTLSLLPYR